jgi:hypothetical protein
MTSQDKYLLLPGKPESQLVEPSYSFLMPECKQATSSRDRRAGVYLSQPLVTVIGSLLRHRERRAGVYLSQQLFTGIGSGGHTRDTCKEKPVDCTAVISCCLYMNYSK